VIRVSFFPVQGNFRNLALWWT